MYCSDALRVAKKAGLPTKYKCETKILKAADRDKLDGKACPECEAVSFVKATIHQATWLLQPTFALQLPCKIARQPSSN